MSLALERRALQAVVALACLVPLSVGGWSVLRGPGFLGHPPVIPTDLDSHFRYISGIFFAVGAPSAGHLFGFAMELGAVPLLMLWQWRLERRWRA